MDFGVAKISNSDMTATGMVMGTVSYMAPEYIRTGKPDPRSDLFAVGVMLYECLSGRKPFAGDTTPTVLYKIVNEAPEPIETEKLKGISPAIRSVLDRALCKNPDERFQTAEDLAKALRAAKDPSWMGQVEEATALLATSAPTAPARPAASDSTLQMVPAPPPAPAAPAAPKAKTAPGGKKGLWIGLAALVLAGLGGATWWAMRGGQAPMSLAGGPATEPTQEPPPGPAEGATKLPAAGSSAPSPQKDAAQLKPQPGGPSRPEPQGEARPEPARPTPAKADPPKAEPKAIDQPELYQPEKLDRMQTHERLNLGNISLSEAIQMADSQPDKAIHGFRQTLKADPYNTNAHAWLAAVLYDQGRMAEFHQEIREARRLGLLGQMVRNVRFKAAFNNARLNRKLPPDLAD
jgi:serine/threonine-protein kinase